MKQHAADTLSSLKKQCKEKTAMEDEVPVLIASRALLACAIQSETTDFVFIEEVKGPFVSFLREGSMMAVITDKEKGDILTLSEFIMTEFPDADCRTRFTSVGKESTRSNVYCDGVLVRISCLY